MEEKSGLILVFASCKEDILELEETGVFGLVLLLLGRLRDILYVYSIYSNPPCWKECIKIYLDNVFRSKIFFSFSSFSLSLCLIPWSRVT